MPLELPSTFAFSQSSLQSYVNCPRRFWLAYVEQLSWPALEAQPYDELEQQLKLGGQFHQLVERAEAELPVDLLTDGLDILWMNGSRATCATGRPIYPRRSLKSSAC